MKESSESRGCIQLSELNTEGDIEVDGKTFEIVLKTRSKDYHLKAATIEEARGWVDAIEAALVAQTNTLLK